MLVGTKGLSINDPHCKPYLPDFSFIGHLEHSSKCSGVRVGGTIFDELTELELFGFGFNNLIDPANFFPNVELRSILLLF